MSNQADQNQTVNYTGRSIGSRVFIISMQKAYTVSSATIFGVVLKGTTQDNVQLYAYVVYDHTEGIAPTVYEIQPEDVFDNKWEALHELEVRVREQQDDHETRIEQLDNVIDMLEDQMDVVYAKKQQQEADNEK